MLLSLDGTYKKQYGGTALNFFFLSSHSSLLFTYFPKYNFLHFYLFLLFLFVQQFCIVMRDGMWVGFNPHSLPFKFWDKNLGGCFCFYFLFLFFVFYFFVLFLWLLMSL